jgi:hypothetical protein
VKFFRHPGFARANSVSNVPHSLGFAFGRAVFGMPTFLTDLVLAGGDAVLDDRGQPAPAFAFLAVDFFDTSAFLLLLAA